MLADALGVGRRDVFEALSPVIFDGRISRRALWRIILAGCETRHGALSQMERRIEALRRTRVRAAIPSAVKMAVRERDSEYCRYCGVLLSRGSRTLDHVIPVVAGGEDSLDNIVLACRLCNGKKGDMTPKEARMYLLPAGTKRVAVPSARERARYINLPQMEDWPRLVTGEIGYAELAAEVTARAERFGVTIIEDS